MAEVRIEQLVKVFSSGGRPVTALAGIDLQAKGHEFVSIVGPSGCGKSTLLNILSGIEEPTRGTVSITEKGAAAKVGYVFQSARLLPWRTALDNMLLVQKDEDRGAAKERCMRFLEMVGLPHVANKFPAQLSGGMQQRVGVARAFSVEPDILLMDEPFSHLDAMSGRSLRSELHALWYQTKKTVIFVTHDIAEAVELSNRVVVMREGGVIDETIDVDLPFPRVASDDDVALLKAKLLRRFESNVA